jgi:hypothetical protein
LAIASAMATYRWSDASDRAVRRRHGEEGKELRLILQPGDLAVQLRPTNPPRKARDSTTQIPQIRHDCFGAARHDSDDVPGDGARFCGLARALPVTTSALPDMSRNADYVPCSVM